MAHARTEKKFVVSAELYDALRELGAINVDAPRAQSTRVVFTNADAWLNTVRNRDTSTPTANPFAKFLLASAGGAAHFEALQKEVEDKTERTFDRAVGVFDEVNISTDIVATRELMNLLSRPPTSPDRVVYQAILRNQPVEHDVAAMTFKGFTTNTVFDATPLQANKLPSCLKVATLPSWLTEAMAAWTKSLRVGDGELSSAPAGTGKTPDSTAGNTGSEPLGLRPNSRGDAGPSGPAGDAQAQPKRNRIRIEPMGEKDIINKLVKLFSDIIGFLPTLTPVELFTIYQQSGLFQIKGQLGPLAEALQDDPVISLKQLTEVLSKKGDPNETMQAFVELGNQLTKRNKSKETKKPRSRPPLPSQPPDETPPLQPPKDDPPLQPPVDDPLVLPPKDDPGHKNCPTHEDPDDDKDVSNPQTPAPDEDTPMSPSLDKGPTRSSKRKTKENAEFDASGAEESDDSDGENGDDDNDEDKGDEDNEDNDEDRGDDDDDDGGDYDEDDDDYKSDDDDAGKGNNGEDGKPRKSLKKKGGLPEVKDSPITDEFQALPEIDAHASESETAKYFKKFAITKTWTKVFRAEEDFMRQPTESGSVVDELTRLESELEETIVGPIRLATYDDDSLQEKSRNEFIAEYTAALEILRLAVGKREPFSDYASKVRRPSFMQALTAVRLRDLTSVGNWSSPGCGKTISAAVASRYVSFSEVDGKQGFVLVFSPSAGGTMLTQWVDAVKSTFSDLKDNATCVNFERPTEFLTLERRRELMKDKLARGNKKREFYFVVNYEFARGPDKVGLLRNIVGDADTAGWPLRTVVFDEIHYLKGADAQQTQSIIHLLENIRKAQKAKGQPEFHVLGMSGTPVKRELKDGWQVLRLFGPKFDEMSTQKMKEIRKMKAANQRILGGVELHRHLVCIGSVRHQIRYDFEMKEERPRVDFPEEYYKDYHGLCETGAAEGGDTKKASGASTIKIQLLLTKARLPKIAEVVKDNVNNGKRTIVYSEYIGGSKDEIGDVAVAADSTSKVFEQKILSMIITNLETLSRPDGSSVRVAVYTGAEKQAPTPGSDTILTRGDHLLGFKQGKYDVLIASSAISTGVDGLQECCSTLVFNVPPPTSAQYEQVVGRLYRRNQTESVVRVIIPQVFLFDQVERSDCKKRELTIRERKQEHNLVLDGELYKRIPEGKEKIAEHLVAWFNRAYEKWKKDQEEAKDVGGNSDMDLDSPDGRDAPPPPPVPPGRPSNGQRKFRSYHREFYNTSSHALNVQFRENPAVFKDYHDLYAQKKKDWTIVPYKIIGNRIVEMVQERMRMEDGEPQPLRVVDMGCGRGWLYAHVKQTLGVANLQSKSVSFLSVDHLIEEAPSRSEETLVECNMAELLSSDAPHASVVQEWKGKVDCVVFSLSFFGPDSGPYLRVAFELLKPGGELVIAETAFRLSEDIVGPFVENVQKIGFTLGTNEDPTKLYKESRAKGWLPTLASDRRIVVCEPPPFAFVVFTKLARKMKENADTVEISFKHANNGDDEEGCDYDDAEGEAEDGSGAMQIDAVDGENTQVRARERRRLGEDTDADTGRDAPPPKRARHDKA